MTSKLLVAVAALALVGSAAMAAGPKQPVGQNGVVVSKDGRLTTATTPSHSAVAGSRRVVDPGATAIYNNIGDFYPNGAYWCCTGYTVTGPNALSGFPEFWEAAAFTPAVDGTANIIKVAVGYVIGTNELRITLNADNGGVPGEELGNFKVDALPTFGSCCVVTAHRTHGGIALTGGQQYWVVLRTGKESANTWAAWNLNDTDQVNPGPGAFWCSDPNGGCGTANNTWTPVNSLPVAGFAVIQSPGG
jgi:hypothetical protein